VLPLTPPGQLAAANSARTERDTNFSGIPGIPESQFGGYNKGDQIPQRPTWRGTPANSAGQTSRGGRNADKNAVQVSTHPLHTHKNSTTDKYTHRHTRTPTPLLPHRAMETLKNAKKNAPVCESPTVLGVGVAAWSVYSRTVAAARKEPRLVMGNGVAAGN